MSSFTNASANSGILRSEIPQQCLNELKTSVFDMFNSFCSKNARWKTLIKRIINWSEDELESEIQEVLHQYPDAEKNFQYTLLKTLKTINQRNGVKDTRIKMSKINTISLQEFYRDFILRLIDTPEMSSQSTYLSLRPSDREILARDAFRHTLYNHSRQLFTDLVDTTQNLVDIQEDHIEPSDSVSQAPSEVISIKPTDDSRLSASILKLHNNTSFQGGGVKMPSINLELQASKVQQKSRVSKKSKKQDVIECEIDSFHSNVKSSASKRPKSHFTRSPRPEKSHLSRLSKISKVKSQVSRKSKAKSQFSRHSKVETKNRTEKPDVPCFFDDDGIDVTTADVATNVFR